jgi:hypothetical protein
MIPSSISATFADASRKYRCRPSQIAEIKPASVSLARCVLAVLGRNPRRKGKLAGGQGTAIEKRRQHRSSRRLPDQRRDLRDERACNHLACIPCRLIGRADEQFDGGRSEF